MNCAGIVDVVLSYAAVVLEIIVDGELLLADVWKIVVALVEDGSASGSELMVSGNRESFCYTVVDKTSNFNYCA